MAPLEKRPEVHYWAFAIGLVGMVIISVALSYDQIWTMDGTPNDMEFGWN